MLVEMIETSPSVWTWRSTDGLNWDITLVGDVRPVEVEQKVDAKSTTKVLIKLKEAGFTAEEIIDMAKAGLLFMEE